MLRFDSKQGYYLYPEAGEAQDLILKLNKGTTYENNVAPRQDVSITKCGLQIPCNVTNYSEFVEQVKKSEAVLRGKIFG